MEAFFPTLSDRELRQCASAANSKRVGIVVDVDVDSRAIRIYNRMWDRRMRDSTGKIVSFYSASSRVDYIGDLALQFPEKDIMPLMLHESKPSHLRNNTHNHRKTKREKKYAKRNRNRKYPDNAPPIDYLADRKSILFLGECGLLMAWRIVTALDKHKKMHLIAVEGLLMHVPKPDDEHAKIAPVRDQDDGRILAAFKHIINQAQKHSIPARPISPSSSELESISE